MITEYKNKMQSAVNDKAVRFAQSSPAIQATIQARYRQHKISASQVGAKPMEWSVWLEREGY